ncbi:hypothetical protein R1sor_008769 [Riccia sorocarpa]|uniref:Peroxidase n=1 Tax=Riccia sorocarpa TaxID=122646 RepID=A0ABD3HUF9_9MARC
MGSARFSLVLLVSYVLLVATNTGAAGLYPTFYSQTCPSVATVVKQEVAKILGKDRNLAGAFVRLQFHDCWVNGCDGSVLLASTAGNSAEVDANTNFRIRGQSQINKIKAAVEAKCPQTVSCADIIALAAREAVVQTGGKTWSVPLGRRDSRVSVARDADANLPFPVLSFDGLVQNFAKKGFNAREMVVLSGSHTIGRTHCNGVAPNLYNFTGKDSLTDTNPNLDVSFANGLKKRCPKGNRVNLVAMDKTKNKFDQGYYKQVLAHKGVFITDDALITTAAGLSAVQEFAKPGSSFFTEFAAAMQKMSKLSPLTGTDGEIRKKCQFVN